MSTARIAFEVYQGSDLKFEVTYTGEDGTPVDLTGATTEIRFSEAAATAPIAGTIDEANGVLSFLIPHATTQNWPTTTSGLGIQVWLTYVNGEREMVVDGTIQVLKSYPSS